MIYFIPLKRYYFIIKVIFTFQMKKYESKLLTLFLVRVEWLFPNF